MKTGVKMQQKFAFSPQTSLCKRSLTGCRSLLCALARCSGLQCRRQEIHGYGGTPFSRLCCVIQRSFAGLKIPSQLCGPGSACSELLWCAIQRLLSLTQDKIDTSPLPQAAAVYMQLPKHAPQSLKVPLTFLFLSQLMAG